MVEEQFSGSRFRMPSVVHEVMVDLFVQRPELAPELLKMLGVKLPEYTNPVIKPATAPALYEADKVVMLPNGDPGKFVAGIVVEVQLDIDPRKRYTWPCYMTGVYAQYECPAYVLVLTVDERVAEWCRKPMEVNPENIARAHVLSPAAVPLLTDEAAVRRTPELAILSCRAHGKDEDAEAVGNLVNATLKTVQEKLPVELEEPLL